MAVTAYLQQFLNEIAKLPDNIRNSLHEITKLEQMTVFEDDSMEIAELVDEIKLSTVDQVETEVLEQLKQKLTRNLSCSAKKIDIINKLYNIVDQEVNRLDHDLKHFENETSTVANHSQQTSSAVASTFTTERKPNDKRPQTKSHSNTQNNNLELELAAGLNMPIDPNEPTYCICHQVSYGNMIMCDNSKCPHEWFHFGCVGLTEQPKGKWFCSQCKTLKRHSSSSRRRR